MKHGLETVLEDLDFEAIDKEIEEADKATWVAQAAIAATGKDHPVPEKGGLGAPVA